MSGSVYGCMAIFSELNAQMDSIDGNKIPRSHALFLNGLKPVFSIHLDIHHHHHQKTYWSKTLQIDVPVVPVTRRTFVPLSLL